MLKRTIDAFRFGSHSAIELEDVRGLAWRQPLTLLAASAWAGIAIDLVCSPVAGFWWSMLIGVIVFRSLSLAKPTPIPATMLILSWCAAFVAIGGMRHHQVLTDYRSANVLDVLTTDPEPTILVGTVEQPVRVIRDRIDFESTIDSGSARNTYRTQMRVDIESLRRGFENVAYTGGVLAWIDGDRSELRPGDRVLVRGKISLVSPPTNPGQDDARRWAARRGIHATMTVSSADDVELLPNSGAESGSGFGVHLRRAIADLAASARSTLLRSVEPEQQGLALALVLGQRDLLDQSTSDKLLVTGTIHLLSVSGLHLGIILILARIVGVLLRLPISGQLVLLTLVAVFYVAITGGRPPVLRAAILLATVVLATFWARPNQPLNSLALAALILAWVIPLEIFSVGMLLSFSAVATLLSCGRVRGRGQTAATQSILLENHFDELVRQTHSSWVRTGSRIIRSTGTALWYSLCVSIITLPIVWHQFNVISVVGVIANVVLSPLMIVALTGGVATVIGGWIFYPFAMMTGWICSQVLWLMHEIVKFAASIPGSHVWLSAPNTSWVIAYYLLIGLILAVRPSGRRRLPIMHWSGIWLVVALLSATTQTKLPEGDLECTFIDVGHGTAAVLRNDEAEVWLYDCGWLGNAEQTSRRIDETLWSMGINRIDGILLSHADTDHFNALPGLANKFKIDCVVTPPGMLDGEGASLRIVKTVIEENDIDVIEVHCDTDFAETLERSGHGGWIAASSILHPPADRINASDNANSLVLRIDHGNRCLLLPGDIEPPGTAVLTSTDRPRPGGVMMAPHHGSLRMDAASVLQWARPLETVVSGGRRSAEPEVTKMLSVAGGGVHVTAKSGAIRVRISNAGEIEIRRWLDDPW